MNNSDALFEIFYLQCNHSMIHGAQDMHEDFAARAIIKTMRGEYHFSKAEIVDFLHIYYYLCNKICEKKYNKGLELARKWLNILDLMRKIRHTNNGYLFAPTESEVALAQENPSFFIVRSQTPIAGSAYRIFNKE